MKNYHPYGEKAIVLVAVVTALVYWHTPLSAQSKVKGVYASRYKATIGSSYTDVASTGSGLSGSYPYKYGTQTVTSNNYQRLDTFTITNTYNGNATAGTSVFIFSNTALPVVKFRRVNNANVSGRRKTLWFESDGNTPSASVAVALRPAYDDSLEAIFAQRLFNMGVDNAFENGTVTNNNNIERIDIIFGGGLKAFNPDSAGFAVFDRGAAGGNDSFMIAAIKSLDANGDPADYYPAVRVGPLNYGAATGTALNFHGLRKEESETHLKLFIAAGNQDREGVFFSFTTLGFPYSSATSPNLVYGYSIMATDVNRAAPGTPKNMVFFNNATIFPTTTELGTVGGIDMVAVTGVATTLATAAALVLPVTATAFTALANDGRVVLSWQLANADAADLVCPERSADGIVFTPLGNSCPAAATGKQYATDAHPLPGQNYYRLRMVDKSGDIAYTPIVNAWINGAVAAPAFLTVYPVPITGRQYTITAPGMPAAACLLEMTDMSGRRVYRQTITGNRLASLHVILPGRLAAGTYSIRIAGTDGTTWLAKNILIQ